MRLQRPRWYGRNAGRSSHTVAGSFFDEVAERCQDAFSSALGLEENDDSATDRELAADVSLEPSYAGIVLESAWRRIASRDLVEVV